MAKKKSTPKPGPLVLNYKTPMRKDILSAMSPEDAFTRLKQGNVRFIDGKKGKTTKPRRREVGKKSNEFIHDSAGGQFPFAIVLSCVDSRIPTEVIFDQEIGDIFNARIAGNFVNEDILGSMEFACGRPIYQEGPDKNSKWVGAKLILVLGHTSCGAIGAACGAVYPMPDNCIKEEKEKEDEVNIPPNLAQMVGKLMPAVAATPCDFSKLDKENKKGPTYRKTFIDRAAETNVRRTMGDILMRSELLRGMARNSAIQVKGAMYDVETGNVRFL